MKDASTTDEETERERERDKEKDGERDAWKGETTAEMTGGVAIETKEAPVISLETNSQETNTGSERE